MLPNEYHPGPRCSCRECLRVWPESEAQRQGTEDPQTDEEGAGDVPPRGDGAGQGPMPSNRS